MADNYILVIQGEKLLLPNFESTRYVESMRQSKMTNRSMDIFSFSDSKELMERNDFDDDQISGSEAQIQFVGFNETKTLTKLRYHAFLETIFTKLTVRVQYIKRTVFSLLADYEQSSINICKLVMSNIAQQRIIPFVSEDILKRSFKITHSKQKTRSKRSSSKNIINKHNQQKIRFRFDLKIQKIQRRTLLKAAFCSLKQCNTRKIISLKQIKKVESVGQFNYNETISRRSNLQLKIIAKYLRKIVIFKCFQKIKSILVQDKIVKGFQLLVGFSNKRKQLFFKQLRYSKKSQKGINKIVRILNLHVIRVQYKFLIQAFYKLKNYQYTRQQSKAFDKLEILLGRKQIKHMYYAFIKLKDSYRNQWSPMKSSNLNGFLNNFSQLMETKIRSRTQDKILFDFDDQQTFKNEIKKTQEYEQKINIGFIEIASSIQRHSVSKHQRPLPPSVFSFKSTSKRSKILIPDKVCETCPDSQNN